MLQTKTVPDMSVDIAGTNWRDAAVSDGDAIALTASEQQVVNAATVAIAGNVLLCKWAAPGNIEFSFFIVSAVFLWLAWAGHAVIKPLRCIGFLCFASLAIGASIFSPVRPAFSALSVVFLIGLHLPFAFAVDVRRVVYIRILRRFLNLCMAMAAIVGIQWLQQFAGMHPLNMETVMPDSLIYRNYAYLQKLDFFSRYYKPNAFFLLEPSHTSQLLAMGMLIELALFRRFARVVVLAMAQVSTFGGTGMLVVLLSLPVLAGYLRPKTALAALAAGTVALIIAYQLGVIDNALERLGGFQAEGGNSATGRFIRPYEIMAQTVNMNTSVALFGLGAGPDNPFILYPGMDLLTPLTKMVTSYGIPIGILYMIWVHGTAFASRVPLIVTWVAVLQYNAVGGGFLIPLSTYYILLLSVLFVPHRFDGRERHAEVHAGDGVPLPAG